MFLLIFLFCLLYLLFFFFFFFQAEDGIRDWSVTGVQTCALPISYRPAIAALTSLVPTTQILFGSDNPFVPLADTAEGITQLGFSADALARIDRDNALSLLPRLKTT